MNRVLFCPQPGSDPKALSDPRCCLKPPKLLPLNLYHAVNQCHLGSEFHGAPFPVCLTHSSARTEEAALAEAARHGAFVHLGASDTRSSSSAAAPIDPRQASTYWDSIAAWQSGVQRFIESGGEGDNPAGPPTPPVSPSASPYPGNSFH